MKLLSCPSLLQPGQGEQLRRNDSLALENQLILNGFESPDITEFGLPAVDIGYASWAALSYFEFQKRRTSLKTEIIEFEIAIQALWWLCSCIKQGCFGRSGNRVRDISTIVTSQFSKLKTIGPTEPFQRRLMVEAIMTTSRLERLVEDVLEFATRGKK